MKLSERERREFSEITEDLLRDYPCLARSRSADDGHRHLLHAVALGLLVASLALEIVGALARQSVVCAIAWLGASIGVSMLLIEPKTSAQRGKMR